MSIYYIEWYNILEGYQTPETGNKFKNFLWIKIPFLFIAFLLLIVIAFLYKKHKKYLN